VIKGLLEEIHVHFTAVFENEVGCIAVFSPKFSKKNIKFQPISQILKLFSEN
jgi:hypothetical protein